MIDGIELLQGCVLVASGRLGFGLSSPWDGNVYLLLDRPDAVIVDAGCGLDHSAVAERVRRRLDGRTVTALLLTHAHADHSAGAAALAAEFDCPVLAHPAGATALATGDAESTGLRGAIADGVYPEGLQIAPIATRDATADPIALGGSSVRAVAAGGHSADHVVYLWERGDDRIAFTGDLVFARGRIAPQTTRDYDEVRLAHAIAELAALAPTALAPGHGEPVLSGVREQLENAVPTRWGMLT